MELEVRVRKTRAVSNLSFVSTETSTVFLLLAHLPGFKEVDIEVKINETRREIIVSGGGRIESMEFVNVFRVANIAREVNVERFCQRFLAPENANFERVSVVFDEEEKRLMVLIPKLVRQHVEEVVSEEVSCCGGNDNLLEENEADENGFEEPSEEAFEFGGTNQVEDIEQREVELFEIDERREASVASSNEARDDNQPWEQESNLFEQDTESFEPQVPYEGPEDQPLEQESNLLQVNTESLEPQVPYEGPDNSDKPKQRSPEFNEDSENEEGSQMEEDKIVMRNGKRRRKRSSHFRLKPATLLAGSAFIFAVVVLFIHFFKHRKPKFNH